MRWGRKGRSGGVKEGSKWRRSIKGERRAELDTWREDGNNRRGVVDGEQLAFDCRRRMMMRIKNNKRRIEHRV